ncbi:uncharacterized protein LOC115400798 [Salarias fasciatus]|uniref:Uncharacterized LOC115400798 n=1 Tax=Salarias fasciatus TaxID=181472 RepID=A0A672J481_SALFA|nr:uncharacterized protein LOC115400798 [Salarias fasciatus]
MDGDLVSLSSSLSSSSAAELSAGTPENSTPQSESSLPTNHEEPKPSGGLWTENVGPVGDRLMSTEEQVTLITESLTVTSNDQEKLLLLNKNTELRRVNKELMKLNEDWDQVYRSATLGLQQRLEAVELENNAIKLLNSRLLLKAKHQQSAKDYYEQALMQELKKNQELQEYIRLLENRMNQPERDCPPAKQDKYSAVARSPTPCPGRTTAGSPNLSHGDVSGYIPSSPFLSASPCPEAGWQGKGQSGGPPLGAPGDSQQEVQALKEQLEALRCQTEIYEAEYQTEHNDHKHTQQENRRLRKKREEMRQQVALLQEQLKIYEDDFRRERSDKQVLQRLLLQKTPPNKDPVLIHRCNNQQQLLEGDRRTAGAEKRKQHHPLCSKHPNRDKESR